MITLLTDFGLIDSYVAQVKGVILSVEPRAQIVDLSHEIPPHQISLGARFLQEAIEQFPGGCVHMAVIDPGVGGKREPIITEFKTPSKGSSYLVGPNNGLFSMLLESVSEKRTVVIENTRSFPELKSGSTFDARNIFAPASASIAKKLIDKEEVNLLEFGSELSSLAKLEKEPGSEVEGSSVFGRVVSIDRFGNMITNISASNICQETARAKVGEHLEELPFYSCYQDIPSGSCGIIVGSQGFLEISANMQSAAEILGAVFGEKIRIQA